MIRRLLWVLVAALLAGCSAPLPVVAPLEASAPTFQLPPTKPGVPSPPETFAPRLSQGFVSAGRFATLTRAKRGLAVAVVDVSTGLPLDLGNPPPWAGPAMPHISADGTLLVYDGFVAFKHRLVAWDVNRKVEVALKGLPDDDPRAADVDAHGTMLIYIAGQPWQPQLAIFDLATSSEHVITLPHALTRNPGSPTLSADGTRAAFVTTGLLGDSHVVVLDVASGRAITPPALDGLAQELAPALDPAGQVVVFSSSRNGTNELFACDIDTGAMKAVGCCDTTGEQSLPRFVGMEGTTLSYVSTTAGAGHTVVVPFKGWR